MTVYVLYAVGEMQFVQGILYAIGPPDAVLKRRLEFDQTGVQFFTNISHDPRTLLSLILLHWIAFFAS